MTNNPKSLSSLSFCRQTVFFLLLFAGTFLNPSFAEMSADCPNGVFANGLMYDADQNLVGNFCAVSGERCNSTYFYAQGAYLEAICDAGAWQAVNSIAPETSPEPESESAPEQQPESPIVAGCPNGVFGDGFIYDANSTYTQNSCATQGETCALTYFYAVASYETALCNNGQWQIASNVESQPEPEPNPELELEPAPEPEPEPEPAQVVGCPNGVFGDGQMYDANSRLTQNSCPTQGQTCPLTYFYGLARYETAFCDSGIWVSDSGVVSDVVEESGAGNEQCGDNVCGDGLSCCNASCGICTAPDTACVQLACEPSSTVPTNLSPMGSNLLGIDDFNQTIAFVDVMRAARPFDQQRWADIDDIEYNAEGWPIRLNGDEAVTVIHGSDPRQTEYVGDYTVLYDGVGTLAYSGAATFKSGSPGKEIISYQPSEDNRAILLRITETDAENPIRNIKVIMPGGICQDNIFERVASAESCVGSSFLSFEEHSDSIVFNPDFLTYVRNFGSIRFMNWMQVNNTSQTSWSENKQLTDFSWSGFGNGTSAPVEIMVALANLTGVDPWFSFPHLTDDDYIQRFAEYVKENLSPDLQSYIEWSNEVWNPQYSQYHYAADMGERLGLDTVRFAAQNKFYARRSVEIFEIWESVFGDTEQFTRVLSSQAVSSFRTSQILEFEDAYKQADAVAINSYFFISDPDSQDVQTVNDVFSGLLASRQMWTNTITAQADLATRFSLDLIAYEGGQSLIGRSDERVNDLYIAANQDPRIAEQITWYMDEWRRLGGQHFVIFTSPNIYDEFGSFGVKEYLTQPRSEAPKFDSYLNWIDANPQWW